MDEIERLRMAINRDLLTCALCGTAGFGLGGVVAGSLHLDLGNPANPLNMGVMGAFGGAALGLLVRDWKRAGLLVLACGVGFTVGSLPAAMMIAFGLPHVRGDVYLGPIVLAVIFLSVYGAIQGLAGVGSLLIALRDRKKTRPGPLIVAGILGFGIAAQAAWAWALGMSTEITLAIWGAVGGAALGAALGYWRSSRPQHEQNSGAPK